MNEFAIGGRLAGRAHVPFVIAEKSGNHSPTSHWLDWNAMIADQATTTTSGEWHGII